MLSVMVPVDLEDPSPVTMSKFTVPVSFSAVLSKSSPEAIAGLRELFQQGLPVDLEVQTSICDDSLEELEGFLTRATADLEVRSPIILCEWRFWNFWYCHEN